MIDRVVRGLAAGANLTAEEILDVLWLAASRSAGQAGLDLDEPTDPAVPEELQQQSFEDDDAEPTQEPKPDLTLHLDAEPTEGEGQTPATEVGFGTPRPIRDALTLPMALRRLRQVRAPGPHLTVDIDATVDATAEAQRLMLVLGRPRERALDLALVVDDAPSMRIWDDTFDDLERLLAQTGAFRAVSRWRLDPHSGAIRPEAHGSPQPPQRLTDPSGRRLVLVATDARDPAWYTARPWDAMAAWCAAMPTVLIQVLPPHYWPTTAIGDPYITTRARRPAAPNKQYDHRIAWWATDPGGLPLPVVTLAPDAVDAWAQAVVNGTAWTSGITATPPDPEYAPDFDGAAEPGALVNDFLSRASPGAQRLARVLASATTLSMPLIAVLRDRLAPETGVLELAEILASGLLVETWPARGTGQPLLRYRRGTRELLRRGTTAFEEWDAYAAVSQYLEDRQRLGGPLRALVPALDGTALLDTSDEPFAALHQALAVRLGLESPAEEERTAAVQEELLTDETGEPLTDEADEPLSSESAVPRAEPDDLYPGPLFGEEELSGFLDRKFGVLGDSDEFMIVEFGRLGPVLWRVSRDEVGTPAGEWSLMAPPGPGESWGAYAARLTASSVNGALLVRSWAEESLAPAFTSIRQEPSLTAFESETSVEDLLRVAVLDSPLTRAYELVLVGESNAGRVQVEGHALFPPGASRGSQATLRIRCAPAADGRVVFATVVMGRSVVDSMHLVNAQSAVLDPGEYTVTATLVQPGIVEFDGLPVELQADERPMREIVETVPSQLTPAAPVHLICLLEISGAEELIGRRIAVLDRVMARLSEQGGQLAISLVTYGPHTVRMGATEAPPAVVAWGVSGSLAQDRLRGIRASRLPDADEYPRAAQLECALREVRNRLFHGDAAVGRPVLVTVGGRPPHPDRVDVRTEIIPCRNRVDWRQQVSELRSIPDITSFAVPDDPAVGWETWRAVGWNGIAGARTDTDLLVATLGVLGQVTGSPFPMIAPQAALTRTLHDEEVTEQEAATEFAVTDAHPEATAPMSYQGGYTASPFTGTARADIVLVGPTGSGKSTFLGALQIALLKQHREWRVWCRDPASRRALVEMNTALTSEGRFPLTTMGIDTFDWILSRKVASTDRSGRFGRRRVEENFELGLKLTDLTGELSRPDQAGLQPREQLVDHVAKSRGILYMFDPIREFNRGDAYERTESLLADLIAAVAEDPDFDGRLPHHVAVCVTKFDDPRVFKTAESLGMLVWDEHDPLGFPRVYDSDARDLLVSLCRLGRNGSGSGVPQLLEQYFHQERISYFVTSAVGFALNKRTRVFDVEDTENVYRIESGESLVRGPVNPINVVEPILWLAERMAGS